VELSETCRVSCQKKILKLVHLVGFIIKKYLTSLLLSIPVPDGGCMKTTETFSTFCTLEGIVSQYWQCTYRVTWRRVRVTVVAVQKQDVFRSQSVCL
jgi:hypothetical protein